MPELLLVLLSGNMCLEAACEKAGKTETESRDSARKRDFCSREDPGSRGGCQAGGPGPLRLREA